MADVTVVSSIIVQPENSNRSGGEKIHLTPFDLNLLQIDYTQRGLLFPKPDPGTRFISRCLLPIRWSLGKVDHQEDKTLSFHIDCNGSGARFIHATADSVSVSDLLQPDGSVPEIFKLFFPMNRVKNINGVSEALLALEVTEIKDGVFISFAYNHMVADGVSIWNFFRTWSRICKNGQRENLDRPIVLRQWFLDGIDFPIRIPPFLRQR
ncbi:hypothetical protein IGI04_002619 [Brassica rapa subsp. trilocularis]|uniref:Acetyltransferase n=1 Tax=Brassica rapa subsp. trilocularis TaxID=1813537 RepID=A0ABQ7NW25_BRACM|nr:hypothetical protein IGI04_002619 [Brassica rapa subsp. trilocularis]